jgi:Mrr N-terminal domain
MSPVLRVSDPTWERLKSHATPLEDTPEDVVRRALDALDLLKEKPELASPLPTQISAPGKPPQKSVAGPKLPQKEFRGPLLEVLLQKGGKATTREIRELLEPKMAPRLSEADYEPVTSGDPRWWNAVCWERNDLVKEFLLAGNSERGVWELTELGRNYAQSIENNEGPDASSTTWRDDIERALDVLDRGGGAGLHQIYEAVRKIRKTAGRSVPTSLEATVRRTLEDNCSNSENFRGIDVFYMPQGKGAGIWGLRRKRQSPA